MWRPATKAVSGTNDVPLANKRRFGLPEEAPPPAAPPSGYPKPPAADMQFFNGRVERDRMSGRERDEVKEERRDDRDDRGGRGGDDSYRRGGEDEYRRDDHRGGGDRERDMERDRNRDRERRYDERDDRDRGRDRDRKEAPPAEEPRKRRSRWGDESTKTDVAGMPVAVMGKVSQTELDNYAIHIRLEEIGRKLRTGDFIPPPHQRSPSPPPQYDAYGRRTNTVDLRYRKKLEDERLKLTDRAMKADPNFRPPMDVGMGIGRGRYGRPQEKVYIPVKEFPEINFFGLLVGPRGNSLKNMERQSGAKISIRGKGSVKEGKGRPGQFPDDEDDELHCLITGDDEGKVKACVNLINKVIETAASTPEGQNDHKRNQLRELASLNGTLRDDENQLCQNCGEKGHRRWDCPQQRVYNANVICRLCGGAGHMARDCRGRGDPNLAGNNANKFDSEYSALMAELGENGGGGGGGPGGPGPSSGGPMLAIGAPPQQNLPPWRIPENWQSNYRSGPQAPHQGFTQPQSQNQGYGYGDYREGMGGGYQGGPGGGQGGGPPGGGGGGGDPYASYYSGLGQTA